MPSFFIYLLKANVALTVCYLAYRFGLRRLTFYTLNRFFLLSGIMFSAVFPLVDINAFFHRHERLAAGLGHYSLDWGALQQVMPPQQAFTLWDVLQYIFWAGAAVMTIRLLTQLISLLRIHLHSGSAIVNGEKVRLMRGKLNPFSFFRQIYINPSLHSPEDIRSILAHEKIHVKGWHTADVMTGEVNNIFYWFNPGAWLMRAAIRENLEFITDRKILQMGMDARAYQYSLVKVSGIPYATALANNFYFSRLKQRIMMMNKKRSSRVNFLRYVLLVPAMAGVILLIFTNSRGQKNNLLNKATSKYGNFPRSPAPPPEARVYSVPPLGSQKSAAPPATGAHERAPFTPPYPVRDSVPEQNHPDAGRHDDVLIMGTGRQNHSHADTVRLKGVTVRGVGNQNPPLLILNDKIIPEAKFKEMDPNQISSVTVLKDEASFRKYGDKGRNGVIIITTKNRNNAPQEEKNINLSEEAVGTPVTVYGKLMNYEKIMETQTGYYVFRNNMTDEEIGRLKDLSLKKSNIKIDVTSIKRDPSTKLITDISVKATDLETGSTASFSNASGSKGGILGVVSKTSDKKMQVEAFEVN